LTRDGLPKMNVSVIDSLKEEISYKVDEIVRLTDEVERLRQALEVLDPRENSGIRSQIVERVVEEPKQVSPSNVSPERPPKPVDTRPLCNACGGRMEPGARTLQSGKTVYFLVCTDSGCNNEQF
jgi:hypothetical protein